MSEALIYEFFEKGVILLIKTKDGRDNYSYTCKLCKKEIHAIKGIKNVIYLNYFLIYESEFKESLQI